MIDGLAGATTDTYHAHTGTTEGHITMTVNIPDTNPTVRTSAEQRHATARARANARTARTSERRSARRVKYTAQPFDPAALLADLNAEGIAR